MSMKKQFYIAGCQMCAHMIAWTNNILSSLELCVYMVDVFTYYV